MWYTSPARWGKKMVIKFPLWMMCIVIFLFGYGVRAASSAESIEFSKWRYGVVLIGHQKEASPAPDWLGTGFFVNKGDRCIIATAKHLFTKAVDRNRLQIAVRSSVQVGMKLSRKATLVYEDPNRDMAFLDTSVDCTKEKAHTFTIANPAEEGFTGDDVFLIGYPKVHPTVIFDTPILRAGVIASTDFTRSKSPLLLIDMFGVNGFSGSPVIKRNGSVVGIHRGPDSQENRTAGFVFATRISPEDTQLW